MNVEALRARVVGELLREKAKADPDRKFVQCGSPWLTLADLDRQSDRLAAGLQSLGLKKGDRLAVLLPNRIEYVVLVYACAKAGIVQVPLSPYLRGEFLRHPLAQSQSVVIVTDGPGLQQVLPLMGELSDLHHVVLFDNPAHGVEISVPVHDFATLAATEAEPARPEIHLTDLCAIMYTSGTTGPSKGCMISHGYYTWYPTAYIRAGWATKGDVIFGVNPLFHFSGQTWTVGMALAADGAAVVEPAFSATTFMPRAAETGATVVLGMGAMAMAIMARPPSDKDKAHSIRLAVWIPLAEAVEKKFSARFGVDALSEAIGQTECGPTALGVLGGERRIGSCGRPIPGMQIRLVDADDNEVPVGEVGEITVRPDKPHMMFQGYWNNPKATADGWQNLWHHTGDNARFDKDGFLYFVDRKKDSVRRKGENISSIELEQAIMKYPGIVQVAVHAVPSALTEDDIKACIVPAGGTTPEIKGLFDFFKKALPYYAVPRYVEFFKELPANPHGRVQKFVLRERGVTAETIDFEALGLVVNKSERRT